MIAARGRLAELSEPKDEELVKRIQDAIAAGLRRATRAHRRLTAATALGRALLPANALSIVETLILEWNVHRQSEALLTPVPSWAGLTYAVDRARWWLSDAARRDLLDSASSGGSQAEDSSARQSSS